ncbi:hypothetical protein LUD75_10585 [Epilithonimonas sp. JDS]|uniref:hypothetical protein n=1 Tax=Epilithonimonas sp. JDS TaxID=2902797 RepID=UPI001E550619|nr:hypothetical protein [Epilithonimonas sp. JDS]MCD9855157.1 hypothetical protein [Epilithonimonas sp. JDS]
MLEKTIFFWSLFLGGIILSAAQVNTATTNGSIGKCEVWDFPYTLYNNAGASQTVNDGITVTVDQNRNIGAVNLSGTGGMDFSGASGITMSGSGTEINCRWDIPEFGHQVVVNNNDIATLNSSGNPFVSYDSGTFFTAPYPGSYRWRMVSGWSAYMIGAYHSGGFGVRKQGSDTYDPIYFKNTYGSCGLAGGTYVVTTWTYPVGPLSLGAGQGLSYAASTVYVAGSSCNNSLLDFVIGAAAIVYEN